MAGKAAENIHQISRFVTNKFMVGNEKKKRARRSVVRGRGKTCDNNVSADESSNTEMRPFVIVNCRQ